MAKYNREFLVPYLESICALHIAYIKVQQRGDEIIGKDEHLLNRLNSLNAPKAPDYKDTVPSIVGAVFGIILIVVSFLNIFILSFFAGLGGWFMLITSVYAFIKNTIENNDNEASYNIAYQRYSQEWDKRNDEFTAHNNSISAECAQLDNESEHIAATLEKVYDANIIPRQYRDVYAAVYLYDWFSTSMADDLDMALNMYVLEEIKDRLDSIISMLSESLMNQKIMLANQTKSIEQQQQYRAEMLGKLNCLQVTAQEQSAYLEMIEANTTAMAYFSAAEYIRKL